MPVVKVGVIAPDVASEEGQLQGSGIIDVRRNIHKALSRPPERHRGGKWVPVKKKSAHANEGHQYLPERSAENAKKTAKKPKNNMASFMKGQINPVQEGLGKIIAGHGRRNEFPSPN